MSRLHAALAATIATVALSLVSLIGTDGAEARNGAPVGPIDAFNRAQVTSTFQTHVVDNRAVNHGWTGSANSCVAGSASSAFDGATLETINWFRRMTGLPAVSENGSASTTAQQAALMMEAQSNLSHFPGSTWACHTPGGAAAAGQSNLTLGISGSRGVLGQIEDPGASNEALGHRRWLLYPRLATVGIGNTARAGAVTVIGDFTGRAAADWIAWPPEGYVPAETVYDRWSLSLNDSQQADFSRAVVAVTENGRSVQVRKLPIANGYGDNTLGWEPIGIDPTQGRDVLYTVTVSNIMVNGSSVTKSYQFVAFDPGASSTIAVSASVSPAGGSHQCRGHNATIVGTSGADIIFGTAGRDVIVGLDGNDQIHGGGGNDVICSGDGNDTVYGDDGDDVVYGGIGRDVLRGGAGHDVVSGQNGRDRIAGNQGNDLLIGGNQGDTLLGNTGHDTCWGFKVGSGSSAVENRRSCESGRN